MTSYSVKDRNYYELDQEKRAKERLIKRSKKQIDKISEDVEITKQLSKSLLQTSPILAVDNSLKILLTTTLKLNDTIVYKTIGNRLRWTIIESNTHNLFNDFTLIRFYITELYNKYNEIFKTLNASQIPDLKIIIEHIDAYFRAWNILYTRLGIYLKVVDAGGNEVDTPIDKQNYLLVMRDVPGAHRVVSDTFALPPNSRFQLNEIFYPVVIIQFQYNKLLRKIQKNLSMYINTNQEIKSGSGFAIPHHKTLHQYVQNHSNQLPQRFL